MDNEELVVGVQQMAQLLIILHNRNGIFSRRSRSVLACVSSGNDSTCSGPFNNHRWPLMLPRAVDICMGRTHLLFLASLLVDGILSDCRKQGQTG